MWLFLQPSGSHGQTELARLQRPCVVVAVVRIAFPGAKARRVCGTWSQPFRPGHPCTKQTHSWEWALSATGCGGWGDVCWWSPATGRPEDWRPCYLAESDKHVRCSATSASNVFYTINPRFNSSLNACQGHSRWQFSYMVKYQAEFEMEIMEFTTTDKWKSKILRSSDINTQKYTHTKWKTWKENILKC